MLPWPWGATDIAGAVCAATLSHWGADCLAPQAPYGAIGSHVPPPAPLDCRQARQVMIAAQRPVLTRWPLGSHAIGERLWCLPGPDHAYVCALWLRSFHLGEPHAVRMENRMNTRMENCLSTRMKKYGKAHEHRMIFLH